MKTSSVTYPGPADAIVIEDDRLDDGRVRIERGKSATVPADLADQLREQWRQGDPNERTLPGVDATLAAAAQEAGEPVSAADTPDTTPPPDSQPAQAAEALETTDTDGR